MFTIHNCKYTVVVSTNSPSEMTGVQEHHFASSPGPLTLQICYLLQLFYQSNFNIHETYMIKDFFEPIQIRGQQTARRHYNYCKQ